MAEFQVVLWYCQSCQEWNMFKKKSHLDLIDYNEEDAAIYYIFTIRSSCSLSAADSTKPILYSLIKGHYFLKKSGFLYFIYHTWFDILFIYLQKADSKFSFRNTEIYSVSKMKLYYYLLATEIISVFQETKATSYGVLAQLWLLDSFNLFGD